MMVPLYFHLLAYLALALRDQLRVASVMMLLAAFAMLAAAHRFQRRPHPTGNIIPFRQRERQDTKRAA